MRKNQAQANGILAWTAPAALCALFALLVWFPVEQAWRHFCLNNYDLGIYAQAFSELSLANPNPWISVRELRIFNDHFDPVLFLLLPFKGLMQPGLFLIRFEAILALATIAPLFWLSAHKKIQLHVATLLATSYLFNRASLGAFLFPAHPGTWAILPLAWTCAFLITERYRAALVAFFFCLLCKEEYPAVGIAFGAGLAWHRRYRAGAGFFVMSAVWALLAFVVRPMLTGSAGQYTGELQSASGLANFSSWGEFKNLGKWLLYLAAPFLAIAWLLRTRETIKSTLQKPAFASITAALLALLAIRASGGWWFSHRSVPVVVVTAFLCACLLQQGIKPTWKITTVLLAVIFACAQPALRPALRVISGKDFATHCPATRERVDAIDQSLTKLRDEMKLKPEGRALVQGNLLPALADAGPVSHLGATRLADSDFTWLLVEKSPAGNPWPLDRDAMQRIIQSWRQSPEVEVLGNGYVHLFKRRENAQHPR
jgi:hypothetical protein